MTTFDQDEYHDATFERLQLTSERITQKTFYDCTFDNCTLSEAQFTMCRFYDCTFKNCDMGLLKVAGTAFISTRFEGCKIIGVNWLEANWESISPRKIDFQSSDVSYSIFSQLKLVGMQLQDCKAHDADFTETDLSEANCRETDFDQARFHHTNLSKANFAGASNYNISPMTNTIKGAKFSLPEAMALLTHFEIKLVET